MEQESEKRIEELRAIVSDDPGSPEFAELAKLLLAGADSRAEAREVCFKGLSRDPRNAIGRIALARSYYMDGYVEFAVRELVELQRYIDVPSLERLLKAFGEHAEPYLAAAPAKPEAKPEGSQGADEEEEEEEEVLAEIDIDDDMVSESFDEVEDEIEVEFGEDEED